ncbi:endo-1,4-beta-xylanase [Pelagicoccus mobilis]|uniref:Beta-xylanase n=1 Tax=Pelagicoccus mobilis TaxID=415221 RepID=A0A934RWN0_9BACT|nr:endo-1,4-beta-xylanase [Pelagicoccus mobilis]MBK1875229.1 endo-1,4-beta-xylanase [Pelagicoccus mobilis]
MFTLLVSIFGGTGPRRSATLATSLLAVGFLLCATLLNASHTLDQYGGWKAKPFEATGFFQTHHDGERWWLVTPEGNAFLSLGLNHYHPNWWTREENKEHWNSVFGAQSEWDEDWKEGFKNEAQTDCERLGINTLGYHCETPILQDAPYGPFMPYIRQYRPIEFSLHLRVGAEGYPDFFSPEFADHCDSVAQQQVAPHANDPWILGWAMADVPTMLDSESAWSGVPTWPRVLRNLGNAAPGKLAYVDTMKERYTGIDTFNTTYSTTFANWEELETAVNWRPNTDTNNRAEVADNNAFLRKCVDEYYRQAKEALRRYDTKHLFLGDKLNGNGDAVDVLADVIAKHVDVLLVQYYALWDVQEAAYDRWAALTGGLPLINGDSTYRAITPEMPNPGITIVPDQEARAFRMLEFGEGAFARPDFVGWHICTILDQWQSTPGYESVQKGGLKTPTGDFYPEPENAITFLSSRLYDIGTGQVDSAALKLFSGYKEDTIPTNFTSCCNPIQLAASNEHSGIDLLLERRSDYDLQGLDYHYQLSSDLEQWQNLEVVNEHVVSVSQSNNIQMDMVRTAISSSQLAGASSLFARLGVTQEAPEAWRVRANQRIDQIRKSNFNITVTDKDGAPIKGAKVHVKLDRHKFLWGAVINELWPVSPHLDTYKEIFLRYFNASGFRLALKPKWVGLTNENRAEQMWPWFMENDIYMRGHLLVWDDPKWWPQDMVDVYNDDSLTDKAKGDKLLEMAERHIHYAIPKWDVECWDVMNEPQTNFAIHNLVEGHSFTHWFKLADEVRKQHGLEDVKLYINEFQVLSAILPYALNRPAIYREIIDQMLAEGAPIEGIGFQARIHSGILSPETVYQRLRAFERYNLPLHITEFEIRNKPAKTYTDEEKVKMVNEMMTIYFSHPSVEGMWHWTFCDLPNGNEPFALFKYDGTPFPCGEEWMRTMDEEFNTDLIAITQADGTTLARGFKGDYTITASYGSDTRVVSATLDDDENVVIKFE